MKFFQATRTFKAIMQESVEDSKGFLAYFIFLLFQFGLIKSQLNFPDKNSIIGNTGIVFGEILGGFDTPGVGEEYVYGVWPIFVIMMIYVNLIGLNSLVALMGDAYGKVQSNAEMYDLLMRLAILMTINQIYVFNRENKDMKYIHFACYADNSGSSADEWEGQVKRIESKINDS